MQKSIIQTSRLAPYKTFLSKEQAKLTENAFIVSFYMLLQCGYLLVKVHLTKSAKFISGHSKLFIMPIKNRTRSYLLSVIMSKTSSYFGDRGL